MMDRWHAILARKPSASIVLSRSLSCTAQALQQADDPALPAELMSPAALSGTTNRRIRICEENRSLRPRVAQPRSQEQMLESRYAFYQTLCGYDGWRRSARTDAWGGAGH